MWVTAVEDKTAEIGYTALMKLTTFGRLALEGSALTRQKPLLLLAYLAVEGAKPRRHLAELFFSETRDPLNSLSKALSNLRRAAAGVVEADHTRAWTKLESDAVGFICHADAGQWRSCKELYQGTFLDDLKLELGFELEEWVLGTREYLAGRYRDILLQFADREAAGGRTAQAAGYAETAYTLTGAPELEPEHFRRVYTLLRLGNNPRAAAVREEAASFDLELSFDKTEFGRGQAEPVHNLPLPKSSFVGRALELRRVAEQLTRSECRLLTLHGIGGVGKSRLALQAAHETLQTGQFRDGITFVPLDALSSADLIPSSLAEALNLTLSGQDDTDTLTQVIRHLGDKQMLLILDNYEHLMEGATLPAKLLEQCPNLKVLVTSRERLNLEEEWVLTLGGLAVPTRSEGTPEETRAFDALELFVQRAKRARLDFVLTDEDLPYALKICELVDGFPLGIELAAVWVKLLPLVEIAGEIEKNVDVLAGSSRNAPERHQSIRAVFEHSWKLLTPQEQDVLKKLSVFVGGFRREAATSAADATLPILASLVDKSLLRVTQDGRYDRHPLLFRFMQEKLAINADALKRAKQEHAAFYGEYLVKHKDDILGSGQQRVIRNFDLELRNIYTAWPHLFEENSNHYLYIAANTLCEYLSIRAKSSAGIKLFEDALRILGSKAQKAPQILAACLYRNIGWLLLETGNPVRARAFSEQALNQMDEREFPVETALTLRHLGNTHLSLGDVPTAKSYFERELQIRRKLNSLVGLGAALQNLGFLYAHLGQYRESEQYLVESLKIGRRINNPDGIAHYLETLGTLYLLMGRHEDAKRAFQESLKISQALSYDRLTPYILDGLGQIFYQEDELDTSKACFLDALKMAEASGDETAIAMLSISYARLNVKLGDFARTQELLSRAFSISNKLELRSLVLSCFVEVAKLLLIQGDSFRAFHLSRYVLASSQASWSTKENAKALAEKCNRSLKNYSAFLKDVHFSDSPRIEAYMHEVIEDE